MKQIIEKNVFRVWNDIDKTWLQDKNIAIGINGMLWLKEDYEFYHFTNDFKSYKVVFNGHLKDDQSKEIYSGDILHVGVDYPEEYSYLAEVVFVNGMFCVSPSVEKPFDTFLYNINKWSRIVGNIFENPELLE